MIKQKAAGLFKVRREEWRGFLSFHQDSSILLNSWQPLCLDFLIVWLTTREIHHLLKQPHFSFVNFLCCRHSYCCTIASESANSCRFLTFVGLLSFLCLWVSFLCNIKVFLVIVLGPVCYYSFFLLSIPSSYPLTALHMACVSFLYYPIQSKASLALATHSCR